MRGEKNNVFDKYIKNDRPMVVGKLAIVVTSWYWHLVYNSNKFCSDSSFSVHN